MVDFHWTMTGLPKGKEILMKHKVWQIVLAAVLALLTFGAIVVVAHGADPPLPTSSSVSYGDDIESGATPTVRVHCAALSTRYDGTPLRTGSFASLLTSRLAMRATIRGTTSGSLT